MPFYYAFLILILYAPIKLTFYLFFFYCLHQIDSILAAISAETMTIHHSKHHATYVTNLNAALEKLDAATSASDISSMISLQAALKFNGGGHLVRIYMLR
jgi:superoxide dismutase